MYTISEIEFVFFVMYKKNVLKLPPHIVYHDYERCNQNKAEKMKHMAQKRSNVVIVFFVFGKGIDAHILKLVRYFLFENSDQYEYFLEIFVFSLFFHMAILSFLLLNTRQIKGFWPFQLKNYIFRWLIDHHIAWVPDKILFTHVKSNWMFCSFIQCIPNKCTHTHQHTHTPRKTTTWNE